MVFARAALNGQPGPLACAPLKGQRARVSLSCGVAALNVDKDDLSLSLDLLSDRPFDLNDLLTGLADAVETLELLPDL